MTVWLGWTYPPLTPHKTARALRAVRGSITLFGKNASFLMEENVAYCSISAAYPAVRSLKFADNNSVRPRGLSIRSSNEKVKSPPHRACTVMYQRLTSRKLLNTSSTVTSAQSICLASTALSGAPAKAPS